MLLSCVTVNVRADEDEDSQKVILSFLDTFDIKISDVLVIDMSNPIEIVVTLSAFRRLVSKGLQPYTRGTHEGIFLEYSGLSIYYMEDHKVQGIIDAVQQDEEYGLCFAYPLEF